MTIPYTNRRIHWLYLGGIVVVVGVLLEVVANEIRDGRSIVERAENRAAIAALEARVRALESHASVR